MLNLNYKWLNFSKVTDYDNFYKESLPEIIKIKGIIENSKILFSMPQSRIILEVAEGERVYKISLLTSGTNKSIFGTLVYLPLDKRLDLYGYNTEYPLIQWKNKKVAYTSYETIFDLAKIDRSFDKIVNTM